jgi:hypothetical protein
MDINTGLISAAGLVLDVINNKDGRIKVDRKNLEFYPLAVLSALSNQDKHRLELPPAIEPLQMEKKLSQEHSIPRADYAV